MSDTTTEPPPAAKTKAPAPDNIHELREQVKVMVGQRIHGALQEDNPSAAQLHVAMKWLEQSAPGNGGGPPTKSPMQIAIEAASAAMRKASKAPDLAPGPDEVDG